MSGPIVAIDGPAGSGKSTVAKMLAKRLSFAHIDTGALYRGVALLAMEKGVSLDDEDLVVKASKGIPFRFQRVAEENLLHLGDRDVGQEIRREEVGLASSKVSAYPKVRALLLNLQREMGENGSVVLEGRDIGTVVFPHAQVKIFLTASLETRAQRRSEELAAKGIQVEWEKVKEEMAKRDTQDTQRAIAPLRQASDAILVDTSAMSIDSVLDRLESIVRNVE